MSTHPVTATAATRRLGTLSRRALAAAVTVLAIAVLLLAHARYGHPALAWSRWWADHHSSAHVFGGRVTPGIGHWY